MTEIRNKLTSGRVIEPRYPYVRLVMSRRAQRDPNALYTEVIGLISGNPRIPDAFIKHLMTCWRKTYSVAGWDDVYDWLARYFRLQRGRE